MVRRSREVPVLRLLKIILHWLQAFATTLACLALFWLSAQHLFHLHILSVQTGSMRPTFRPGDALLMQNTNVSKLQVGQVVSYRSARNPNELITHRLVRVDSAHEIFQTKGDVLHAPDPAVRNTLLVGRVVAILPGLGRTLSWFHTWPALILCVYLPAAAITITELVRLERHYHRPYRLKRRQDAIVLV